MSKQQTPRRYWADDEEGKYKIGSVGFIVERTHTLEGWTRYYLYQRPAHTNMSHCPKLYGWCGTTNDVGVFAHGLGIVANILANNRTCFLAIDDADREAITEALDSLGYPELADERQE